MRITTYSVYIVSNYLRTVLYIGVTNNLVRRIAEHKSGKVPALQPGTIVITWKLNLIREQNPEMKDLSTEWMA